MSDPIKPALTKEEWTDLRADGLQMRGVKIGFRTHWLDFYCGDDDGHAHVETEQGDAVMAMANAALPADHPLKLTRADVALVAGVAALSKHGEVADALSRVAAKLAALLPPESP